MKRLLYIPFFLLLLCTSCEKLDFTDDDSADSTKKENNSAGKQDNNADATPSAPEREGYYHGFDTIEEYLTVYGDSLNPIPISDILPGGFLYTDIVVDGTYYLSDVWIAGYIVGYISGNSIGGVQFTTEGAVHTNIVLAETIEETDPYRCIPVQLSKSTPTQETARYYLNLDNYPQKFHRHARLQGDLNKYMGTLGLLRTIHFRVR